MAHQFVMIDSIEELFQIEVDHPSVDPYVRWCGRGGAERLPPIPIIGTKRTWRDVRLAAPLALPAPDWRWGALCSRF